MRNKIYDVIICGAGPAGTSAGYQLTNAGLKVLILDKYKFPRVKSCAGCIPPYLINDIPEIKDILEAESGEIIFSYCSETRLVKKINRRVCFIMRDKFDMLLLDRAIKQGCLFNESEKLTAAQIKNDLIEIQTSKNIYLTKYLIGADGALSAVNRIFNIINRNNGITINAEIKLKSKIFDKFKSKILIDIGDCENGYFWAFPKKNHISFGMGSSNKKYNGFKNIFFKILKKMIEDFDEADIMYIKGAPIPFFNGKEKLNKDNVLLVGDAANLVNPFNGAGICYAIKSGEFAADAIIKTEKQTAAIDDYNISVSEIIESFVKAKQRAGHFFRYEKFIATVYSNEKVLELFSRLFLRI